MMGPFVRRMIGAVRAGFSIARVAVERLLDHGIVGLVIPVWFFVIRVGDQRPPMAFVPSEIGPADLLHESADVGARLAVEFKFDSITL
jgi:hypothetical protein